MLVDFGEKFIREIWFVWLTVVFESKRKDAIQGASIQSGTIETLIEIIRRDNEEIKKLQSDKLESQKLLKDTSFWKKGSIEESIKFNQDRINL